MLENWIVIAGCAGGVGGFVFGVVVERTRQAIVKHRHELHEERIRAIAMTREVAAVSPSQRPYANGSAHAHEQRAPLDA